MGPDARAPQHRLRRGLLARPPGQPGDRAPAAAGQDRDKLLRGARLFREHCAGCHSSKPGDPGKDPEAFLDRNFLADERRYSVTELGTNMARALATNAVEGDVWAEFSSRD